MSRKARVTVTLDREIIDTGNAAVAAGLADSLSAWMNMVLGEHRENERGLTVLKELVSDYEAKHGAFTAEEMAEGERRDRRNAIVVRGGRIHRPNKRRSRAR